MKSNPKMDKKTINDLLNKILGKDSKIISSLYGGMMNLSFIVEKDNKKYVLYIPTEQANEMVNRPLEKEHLEIGYKNKISAKNVYFDVNTGVKINEYIEGESLNNVSSWDYQKVADVLRIFHHANAKINTDYNPFKRFKNIYELEAKTYIESRNDKYEFLRGFLFEKKDFLEKQDKTISHNDFQRSNIIKSSDGNYYLIDYEFAANNDPIYDIAAFGNTVVEEGRTLLDYYLKKPNKEEIERFYLWRIFLSLQWYNVAITKHYRGEGEKHHIDFNQVALFFLNNAEHAYELYKKEIR